MQEIAFISMNRRIASGVICNAGGRWRGFRLLLIEVAPIQAGSRPASGRSQRLNVEPQPCKQTANKAPCSRLVSQQGVILEAMFGRNHRTLLGNDGGTFGGPVC